MFADPEPKYGAIGSMSKVKKYRSLVMCNNSEMKLLVVKCGYKSRNADCWQYCHNDVEYSCIKITLNHSPEALKPM